MPGYGCDCSDMKKRKYFRHQGGKISLPVFFPDATQAVVRTIDSSDLRNTKTPGILVNTYHLFEGLGGRVLKKFGGVRNFMDWNSAVISDSGGFQIMSIAKKNLKKSKISDEGVVFRPSANKKIKLTPEESIKFQMILNTDMVIVLDDFTPPGASFKKAEETVNRTILWAEKCKGEYEKICKKQGLMSSKRPYILGVIQGGDHPELRQKCAEELVKIGFDGLGYGGWPITSENKFDYKMAKFISELTPENYFLYGLGIGKPEEIVALVKMGYNIFDCVLPTRDARHRRLYVYNASSIDQIDLEKPDFYSFYTPDKQKYYSDKSPVSYACDCLLCTNYTRAYLAHLFRIKETLALRLATIHNLRFYSILMENLRKIY
jgi:queuine tRNA-ribosyltransferase